MRACGATQTVLYWVKLTTQNSVLKALRGNITQVASVRPELDLGGPP